jgi:uncharacterized protein
MLVNTVAGLAALILISNSTEAFAANPTIVVRGTGEVEVAPDIASVVVEIRSRDKEPSKAQAKNVAITKKLFAALQGIGVKRSNLGSTGYVFKRDARTDSEGKIIELGYYAENSVQVKAEKFDDLPSIIANSVANGATSIGDVSYTLSDTKTYIDRAREEAFQNAKDEAQKSAKAAGMLLGSIKTISLGDAYIPAVAASSSPDGAADIPAAQLEPLLNPGTIRVSYTVTIEYELK